MALTEVRADGTSSRIQLPPVRGRAGRPRRPEGELVAAALLAAALLAAFAGFHVLLQDLSWYLVGAVYIVLVLTAANLARRVLRAAWAPPLIALAVAIVGLTAGYAADRALLGVVPTPGALDRFGQLVDDAWLSIAEQALPATPEIGIVFLLAVLAAGCALFGDLVVRRAPALTVIPLLAMLGVPVAVRSGVADPVWYVVTAILYLMLLRRGQWRAALPSIAAVGAVVVAGSLVAPFVLPPVRDSSETGTGIGIDAAVDPLINLGDDLRRGTAVTAVTYSTSSDQPVYLRLATLDTFDGREWAPSDAEPSKRNTVAAFPSPTGLTGAVARTTLTAHVQVGDIGGRWLPVPYPSSTIRGLDGDWRWVSGGLSVRSQNTNAGGQGFDVSFLDVQPDLSQLEAASLASVAEVGDLDLPSGMPSIIAEDAQQVTAGAATEYDKALALQTWFRETGGFTYSETAPVKQGYDGTGAQIIARFLQNRTGYCVHFASAMAVMARTLGIPARVVVGFQPGTASTVNGTSSFRVSSHDLHAWPELYFAGIGWLRFEPTPGRGELPIYSAPAAVDDSVSAGSATAGATPAPTGGDAVPGKVAPDATDGASASAAAGAGAAASGTGPAPWIVLAVLLVLVALAASPAIIRGVQRARRMRAIARGRDPARIAWAELRDTARDHGWLAPESETPRQFAGRLAVVLVEDGPAIRTLTRSVEASAYAPGPGPVSPAELRAVRRAIASMTLGRDRVRAVLLPPSLIARLRGDTDESRVE